ncbi:pyridoxamine 5'-phosphate oxidase family protein [Herbaspirillum sp. LeCh32-8]|uniref:pyridoxamine 5'-phosphate oxidase family protein n=1 Tax=Herbaspirillum sp. LeCh32-8 TaxID=2821356 RepID=UPI001AE358DA|nr:pyridoxamine 5'-phosphate oxidase family protein [Herbaspirillum sp. LeCh32-8]MBP0598182.1 pyridoxamine 5'-phosphate oxidase family protein [Herbaspirillum sp. LeCh32-8]
MPHQAFHRGELHAQQRAGMLEKMAAIGPRVIRDFMPDQHRDFFQQLPFLVVGSVDASGQPWASIISGAPGFIQSPDMHSLQVRGLHLAAQDPLAANLHSGAKLGLLGLEPHTRRRNRANGVVQALQQGGLDIAIEQSFGNCPKYIQARKPELQDIAALPAATVTDSAALTPAMTEMIRRADTFFIATALAGDDAEAHGDGHRHGADVSHRGGKPGFVRVDGDRTLTVPDFIGNSFFNTIGNLLVQPRAGLLFADFDSSALLYLAMTAEVIWEGAEVEAFAGAQRLMRFTVQSARLLENALPLRWGEAALSPFLEPTGAWN